MSVPLLDLKAQHATIRDAVLPQLTQLIDDQAFILGAPVGALECEVAGLSQVKYAVGCANGTDAILLALRALGVGREDEVITTPFTFFATGGAVHNVGARPVFVDIDPRTFNIDPSCIPPALGDRTRAIIAVDLFGQMAPIEQVTAVARGLPVIEDAAQSILSTWRGKCTGAIGDVGCFSFYPTKNLGGVGDGGFMTTVRDDLAAKLRLLRVHGMEPRYYHQVVGINSRLDSIQAAVLRVKLPHLDDWTTARQSNAARYSALFAEYDLERHVAVPTDEPRGRHVWNQFVIRIAGGQRDALRAHLGKCGVGTEIYYPVPLHMQKCFAHLGWGKGIFPHSERAALEAIALPIYPDLTPVQLEHVAASVIESVRNRTSSAR